MLGGGYFRAGSEGQGVNGGEEGVDDSEHIHFDQVS